MFPEPDCRSSVLIDLETMASSFPKLKYLKIEMNSEKYINVRDVLKHFPYLETLSLKIRSTFDGKSISLHQNIKHVKIDEIKTRFLIEAIRFMPRLESLAIGKKQFSLEKHFLQNIHANLPNSLKTLKIKFSSRSGEDFAHRNSIYASMDALTIIKNICNCNICRYS